jgi:peroxiredoxin
VRVLALSGDPVDAAARFRERAALPFTLLADPDLRVVSRCRVSHCLVLLDGSGAIRWTAFTDNWRGLPDYAAILQNAVALGRSQM